MSNLYPNQEQPEPLLPYQQRVVEEHRLLAERLSKLHEFCNTPKCSALPSMERALLFEQRTHMALYLATLEARLRLWNIRI